MNLLAMDNVSKTYGEKVLFQGVSFGIDEGEKIGLVGINGSGKSTFLKIVAGQEETDQGSIVRKRNLRIEYLPQNPPFDPTATVLDTALNGDSPAMHALQKYKDLVAETLTKPANDSTQQELMQLNQQIEAMDAWSLESNAQDILTRLGITQFNTLMSELSGGQRKRVALSTALMNPADLLILDEPTNHLDTQAIDWLEKYLQRFNGALLMVTHDRYFLERVVNRIVEVEQGNLYSYPGNYSIYLERKLEREEKEEAMASKKQTLLRKELAWIRRGARARSTKQKARIQRYEKLQEDQPSLTSANMEISSTASRLGKKTIILKDVSQSYGDEKVIGSYSFILARDERMGIVGPNGIGKSTLLRIMSSELSPTLGNVEIGSTVIIGYFPQVSIDLPDEQRVIDYIREAGEYLQTGKKQLSASQMLETFLFPPVAQWTTLQKLSGGEKRRLHLLRILMGAPNVLLLDEPGNDLDIETLTILENYLDDFPGAVVAVSHDRYFLDRISNKILAFEGQGKLNEYPGNYSDYLLYSADKEDNKPLKAPDQLTEKKKNSREKENTGRIRFSYNEQKEFEEIDDKIEAVEKELQEVNERINKAGSDYQLLEELIAFRQDVEKRQDDLLERWTYLNELAEKIEKQRNL
jgi:ATP-binding cassette subfamily F protein uup